MFLMQGASSTPAGWDRGSDEDPISRGGRQRGVRPQELAASGADDQHPPAGPVHRRNYRGEALPCAPRSECRPHGTALSACGVPCEGSVALLSWRFVGTLFCVFKRNIAPPSHQSPRPPAHSRMIDTLLDGLMTILTDVITPASDAAVFNGEYAVYRHYGFVNAPLRAACPARELCLRAHDVLWNALLCYLLKNNVGSPSHQAPHPQAHLL